MNQLRNLRLKRNVSMLQIAKELNIPYTTYVNYEKGNREPNSKMLILLSDFFGVSVDYLIGRTEIVCDNDAICSHNNNDEYTAKEKSIIKKFLKLNNLGQNKCEMYVNDLLEVPKYTKPNNKPPTFYVAARGNSHLETKAKGTLEEIIEEIKDD